MADLNTLRERLLEAELAYHRLSTGTAEVQVEQGGEVAMKVAYNLASVDKLKVYMDQLRRDIAAITGDASGLQRRRPMYVEL